MKYTYAYKTRDGVRHEAALEAPSRDEAFVALRRQGIKPIKVVAADGSKANGEMRGVRKRVVAAVVVAATAVVVTLLFRLFRTEEALSTLNARYAPEAVAPRHQIYGDPAVMESLENGRLDGVFARETDRMLAWFAQPGRLMCPNGTNLRTATETFAAAYLREGDDASPLTVTAGDSREVRELKQIVNGLREEMHGYLANGLGTPRSYWRRLNERLNQELQIHARTQRELDREKDAAVWDRKNEALRRLGIRTIPNPKDVE